MIPILFYSLLLININIIVKKKQSKVAAIFFCIVLIMIFWGNTRSGYSDLTSYRYRYENNTSMDIFGNFGEIGYGLSATFFSNAGVSFQSFLLIIAIVCFACIKLVINKLGSNVNINLIVTVFSLFYLFFCMEGIRFFIAVSIATVGFYFLSQETKLRYFIFFGCVLLSATFHSSLLYLIPFVFFDKVGKDKLNKKEIIFKIDKIRIDIFLADTWSNKRLGILTIISFVLLILNLSFGNSAIYLATFFDKLGFNEGLQYKISYYTSSTTHLGWIPRAMYQVLNLIIMRQVKQTTIENIDLYNNNTILFIKMVYRLNIYMMLFLPMIMINTTFFRYALMCTTLIIICVGCVFKECIYSGNVYNTAIYNNRQYWIMIFAFFFYTVIWWYMKVNVYSQIEALLPNIFNLGIYDSFVPNI